MPYKLIKTLTYINIEIVSYTIISEVTCVMQAVMPNSILVLSIGMLTLESTARFLSWWLTESGVTNLKFHLQILFHFFLLFKLTNHQSKIKTTSISSSVLYILTLPSLFLFLCSMLSFHIHWVSSFDSQQCSPCLHIFHSHLI